MLFVDVDIVDDVCVGRVNVMCVVFGWRGVCGVVRKGTKGKIKIKKGEAK